MASRVLPAVPARSVTYNRQAALQYARTNWTKVCTDNYVGIASPPSYRQVDPATVFVRTTTTNPSSEVAQLGDGTLIPLSALEDCTHFLSCCLGNPPGGMGGGLPIKSDFNTIFGRLSADRLYHDLVGENRVDIVAERNSYSQAEPLISQLQAGDLIFYFDVPANRYGHSALYLAGSDKRIACHTYCRGDSTNDYDQSWKSVNLGQCTLLKLKAVQSFV